MSTTEGKLFDLDAIRAKVRDGAQINSVRYPWGMIGPIEQATFMGLQQEIRDLAKGAAEGNFSIEQAKQIVVAQRAILNLILPTLPDELAVQMHDEEVGALIGFFDVWRTNKAVDQMEDQMAPAERAAERMKRVQTIGANFSPPSNASMGATPRAG